MRLIGRIMIFGLLVQTFSIMLSASVGVNPFLIQKTITVKDPEEVVSSYNWQDTSATTGDIQSAFMFIWNMNLPGVESLIIFMKNIGVPNDFVQPIQAFWRVLIMLFIAEWYSGRKILGDY